MSASKLCNPLLHSWEARKCRRNVSEGGKVLNDSISYFLCRLKPEPKPPIEPNLKPNDSDHNSYVTITDLAKQAPAHVTHPLSIPSCEPPLDPTPGCNSYSLTHNRSLRIFLSKMQANCKTGISENIVQNSQIINFGEKK